MLCVTGTQKSVARLDTNVAFDRRFNVAVVSAKVLEAAGPNVDGVTSTPSSATWPKWRSIMMHFFTVCSRMNQAMFIA